MNHEERFNHRDHRGHREEELFKKAKSLPLIDLRFNTEMIHAWQEAGKVYVEVLNRETQKKEALTAKYLIAADGANSPLRKIFNVEMEGEEDLGSFCNIYCEVNYPRLKAKALWLALKRLPPACGLRRTLP